MPIAFTRPLNWQKRSVLFGSLAMVIGAVVALDFPSVLLYRLALGLDVLVVLALGVLFVRLKNLGTIAE